MNWTRLDVPEKYRRMYERARKGKSRRAAIRCHCLLCVGWQEREVELCTATGCPLYPYRLGSTSDPRATGGAEPPGSTNASPDVVKVGCARNV